MVSAKRVPANEIIETYNKAGGADYDSLAVWESLRDENLVATTTSYGLKFVGLGPHSDFTNVVGGTTNATYFRRIFADPSLLHGGIPGAGVVLTSSSSSATILSSEQYFQVQDLEVNNTNSTGDSLQLGLNAAAVGCIAGGAGEGFVCASASGFCFFINCFAFNCGVAGFRDSSGAGVQVIDNSFAKGSPTGFIASTTTIAKNCISQGNTTGFSGTFGTKTNCISDDATGNIQATLTFVDAPNNNYRLAATDTAAIGAGADLSADATYPFNDDIVGETRTAPWDIGAFKFIYPTLSVSISETTLSSDVFTVAASMAHQLQEMALAGDSWAQNMIANLMLTEGAVASDSYTPSLSASLSISEIALASDTWIGRLYASATISEIALASEMFDTFDPVERGMIHAIIRIIPAISARIDINKHYNE